MTKARDLANASTALSAVSATELAFVDGVTSAIQTQMDAKAPSSTAVTLTGTQTLTNKTLTSPVIASVINNTLTSTTGDIIYASAANTPARLGIGSTSQVLTVTSGVPVWATPSSSPTFHGGAVYANSQSIPDSTATAVAFPNEQFDTDGYHSTTTNTSRVTIPSGLGGYYYFTFTGALSANTAGNRDVFLRKNGSLFRGSFGGASAAGRANLQINQILNCAVADYIEIFVTQDSGTSLTLFENASVGGASFNWTFLGA